MSKLGRFLGGLVTLAILALLVYGLFNLRAIDDWLKLRDYTPPAAIEQLAMATTMTSEAKRVFYVNQPRLINDKTIFRQECMQIEQTIVLGCYHGGQRGIVIFEVSDSRLDGIEEVTAAHEMLHAGYERLNSAERQNIDNWLEDYYQNQLKDQRILKNIEAYKTSEPNDVINEMHSIFATEVARLPNQLENYYKRYFSNRTKVVKYSQRYEAAFTTREAQAGALLARLNDLRAEISQLSSQLTAERQALEADRNNIDSQAEASAFNGRVRSYNSRVEYLNALISRYNDLREEYNELVLQHRELIEAIDTSHTAQPAH